MKQPALATPKNKPWQLNDEDGATISYFRELAESGSAHVLPAKRPLYARNAELLQEEKLRKLERQRRTSHGQSGGQQSEDARFRIFNEYISDLHKQVQANSAEERAQAADIRAERAKIELLYKRFALQYPVDEQVFEEALRWMYGRGDADELDLLREISKSPPFMSESIGRLIKRVDLSICQKVYHPQRVVQEGELAYQRNREDWNRRYAGQFIAVHRGAIEFAAKTKDDLLKQLAQKQQAWGPFRAYIIQVSAPILVLRPRDGGEGAGTLVMAGKSS